MSIMHLILLCLALLGLTFTIGMVSILVLMSSQRGYDRQLWRSALIPLLCALLLVGVSVVLFFAGI